MSTRPVRSTIPPRSRAAPGLSRLSRWAVGLAMLVVAMLVVSYAIFGVTYAVGGEDAVTDTWVGALGGAALLGGLGASLVAFVLAVVAKVTHIPHALLWLPLAVFPSLGAIVLITELFWLE